MKSLFVEYTIIMQWIPNSLISHKIASLIELRLYIDK